MTLVPCTPSLPPYRTLKWLGTVPVTNNIYEKRRITKLVWPPSLLQSKWKTANISVQTSYLFLNVKLWLEAKHIVVHPKKTPIVRSMALAPWTPRLQPCHMINWLGTVLVTNRFHIELTNYQSGLSSFNVTIKMKNDQYFSAEILHFIERFFVLIVINSVSVLVMCDISK